MSSLSLKSNCGDLTMYRNKRVGVLVGGLSSERDVSLKSGAAVANALRRRGYNVVVIDAMRDVAQTLVKERVEVVYVALHGKLGEDGAIQGLLEVLGIPYSGSGLLASALSMDKAASRRIFEARNLPTPPWIEVKEGEEVDPKSIPFEPPYVVKPSCEGSSVGVSIKVFPDKLSSALKRAFYYDDRALIEKYIKGREICVGVLNDEAIGTVEIRPKREFYDYKAKYEDENTEHFCPAPLNKKLEKKILKIGLEAHRSIGAEGGTRVDLRLDGDRPYLLELNALPGLTDVSLLPEIARHAGIEFDEFVERILNSARLKIRVKELKE